MTITYDELDVSTVVKEYKETAIYNATYLFALIDDAEWITFIFPNGEYKLSKTALEDWYGKELSEFSNEEDIRDNINKQLEDKNKVDELLGE